MQADGPSPAESSQQTMDSDTASLYRQQDLSLKASPSVLAVNGCECLGGRV